MLCLLGPRCRKNRQFYVYKLSIILIWTRFDRARAIKVLLTRPPAAIPQSALLACAKMIKAYAVALASLLAGATFVHNVYKPDLVRGPPLQ